MASVVRIIVGNTKRFSNPAVIRSVRQFASARK